MNLGISSGGAQIRNDLNVNTLLVKHQSSLSFIYTNATSLNNKMNDLRAYVSTVHPHVICINETWFSEISDTNITGYTIYKNDRKNGKKGGGVCIYVTDQLVSKEELPSLITNNKEEIWISIKSKDENVLIGCIYRPPNSDNEINEK